MPFFAVGTYSPVTRVSPQTPGMLNYTIHHKLLRASGQNAAALQPVADGQLIFTHCVDDEGDQAVIPKSVYESRIARIARR